MKTKSRAVISAISLIITLLAPAQDTLNYKTGFPSGISVECGLGSYSVKDAYTSNEKYSGTLPYLNVEWVRFHIKNAYRLEFEYRYSSNISNNNISAKVGQFTFNHDFIYPVGNFSLFSRCVYAYLGPSIQFFYYNIRYNFVTPGTFISPKIFGIIGSLGINAELTYQVNNKFQVEGLLRSNIISFSGKELDERKYEDESCPTLLSVFTATKFDFDLSVRYYPADKFSISMGYKFDLSRIDKWDPYIAASTSMIISLNYTF